ncbi:putative quinol monooxygenase [Elizabethkingia meningoseptica]|uniref:putative quinol monooxygenase n=2 Tax=Elizabethkingia meningoseptica TaxID=238 RepID=UPI0021A4FB35|nr:putative quinol monooxygenase [Elizabethkingia meningoseptica]MEC4712336.1 putative quinol monooxygenase [Elizabethkingia meningoseptica]
MQIVIPKERDFTVLSTETYITSSNNNDMNIYLTAILKAKKDKRNELLPILQNMVVNTLKEKACLKYELQQGIEDENIFIFHEIWKNAEGLEQHNQQDYIKAFSLKAEELLDEPAQLYLANLL